MNDQYSVNGTFSLLAIALQQKKFYSLPTWMGRRHESISVGIWSDIVGEVNEPIETNFKIKS